MELDRSLVRQLECPYRVVGTKVLAGGLHQRALLLVVGIAGCLWPRARGRSGSVWCVLVDCRRVLHDGDGERGVVSSRPLEAATGVTVTQLCDPPIVRRFALLLGLCLVGFVLSRRGWKDLDDGRYIRRALLICVGMLLSG